MAPSEIPKVAATSTGAGLSSSRYLSSSSATPSSAPPSPPSKNTKEQQKGMVVGGSDSIDSETPMADSPADSAEEIYWSHHESDHDDHGDSPEDYHKHGDSGEIVESEQQQGKQHHQRRPRVRSSARYASDKFNGSSVRTVPEVKYAKGGILSPTNVIMDRSVNGVGGVDGIGQVQPGDSVYLSQSPGNRPTGQYQMHPGYNNGNGVNGNGNYNNGNGNTNGGYGANGASSPQPHPFNGNGGQPLPHYPFHHYPQAQPGAAPYPINYYDPHGQYVITSNTTSGNGLNVRGEEVGIVLVVLLLWVGAIILFFNRWGKIRMLEPYQPKFCENHRPSCPMADVTAITNIPVCRERGFSKYNLSTEMLAGPNGSPHFVKCNYHGIPSADPAPGFSGLTTTSGLPGGLTIPGAGFPGGGSTGMLSNHRNSMMMMNPHFQHHHHLRPRQNSVFVTSPSSQVSFYGSDTALKSSSRKTKSAVDLPTLVLTGEFMDNVRRNSKNSITQL